MEAKSLPSSQKRVCRWPDDIFGRDRHAPGTREWARDADGDGVREVHNNTCEGLWTGLRNFLRPFRGVSKWHLWGYVAIFQWAYKVKRVVAALIQALFGIRPSTELGP
jgi:transposase